MIELYGHSGSVNHGCEAIVRGTVKVLGNVDILWSSDINSDKKYGLNKLLMLNQQVKKIPRNSFLRYYLAIKTRLLKNQWYYYKEMYKPFFENMNSESTYLSIGGDHYCYGPVSNQIYGNLNRELIKRRNKTILWGCSIEPNDLNETTLQDLSSYKYVITRESLSYNALIEKGLNNVELIPDVAFQLDTILPKLPNNFKENNTVGINLSPLVGKYNYKELIMENYRQIITYILKNSNMSIALIPHVVELNNDDRTVLKEIKNFYLNEDRVIFIDDHKAEELKGYISKCRFFIGARTHSTIAAYSSCIPTLVLGYSIKAKGIAYDLFGEIDNFVCPVQDLVTPEDLLNKFKYIMENETNIKKHLENIMPEYKKRILRLKELV